MTFLIRHPARRPLALLPILAAGHAAAAALAAPAESRALTTVFHSGATHPKHP
jgi:hypothetical protein